MTALTRTALAMAATLTRIALPVIAALTRAALAATTALTRIALPVIAALTRGPLAMSAALAGVAVARVAVTRVAVAATLTRTVPPVARLTGAGLPGPVVPRRSAVVPPD